MNKLVNFSYKLVDQGHLFVSIQLHLISSTKGVIQHITSSLNTKVQIIIIHFIKITIIYKSSLKSLTKTFFINNCHEFIHFVTNLHFIQRLITSLPAPSTFTEDLIISFSSREEHLTLYIFF